MVNHAAYIVHKEVEDLPSNVHITLAIFHEAAFHHSAPGALHSDVFKAREENAAKVNVAHTLRMLDSYAKLSDRYL